VIAHRKICECGQRRKNVEYSFGRWTSPCRPTSPSRGGQGLTSTRLALITVTSRVAQFGRDNHLLFDLHISRMWTRMPKQPESQTTGMAGSQSARMSGHQDIRKPGSQGVRVRTSRALRDPRDEHCNFPAPVDGHRTSLTAGVVHFRRQQFKGRVA